MKTQLIFSSTKHPFNLFPSLESIEKLIFPRLIKNAQMQGARNPEE